jgi:DNA-binding NtrC family response regulator
MSEPESDPPVADRQGTKVIVLDAQTSSLSLRKCKLTVVEGPDRAKELVVDREVVRIGASDNNDLTLTDPTVSGRHLEIRLREDGFLAKDLGSTNGTFLGGHRALEFYLNSGSVFNVGATAIRFTPLDERVRIELSNRSRFGEMLGESLKMREIFAVLEKIAPKDITVLIEGETGTGKEVCARAIHNSSKRASGPFIIFDCGATPANLIESELFGHVKGAFTGAVQSRAGAFESADGGTIFFDELGELSLDLQPKLLRVLETREVKRVGATTPVKVDVRVVAATNRDLRKEVRGGNFREDLFYRLAVARVTLPSLRERREDIAMLARSFLRDATGDPNREISEATLTFLRKHDWPGNIRELRNVIERAISLSDSGTLSTLDFPVRLKDEPGGAGPFVANHLPYKEAKDAWLVHFEKTYLIELLRRNASNISRAALEAGIPRQTLHRLIKKHGIKARDA